MHYSSFLLFADSMSCGYACSCHPAAAAAPSWCNNRILVFCLSNYYAHSDFSLCFIVFSKLKLSYFGNEDTLKCKNGVIFFFHMICVLWVKEMSISCNRTLYGAWICKIFIFTKIWFFLLIAFVRKWPFNSVRLLWVMGNDIYGQLSCLHNISCSVPL